jgi:hypothetical protein
MENKDETITKNLYLDRERQKFINIELNNDSTIETILNNYRETLIKEITAIYKLNIEEFIFVIIESKINMKKDEIISLTEYKLNKTIKIYLLLQNPQNNIYFLPKNKRIFPNKKNYSIPPNNIQSEFEKAQNNYFLSKPTEEYLSKANFLLYDNENQIMTKEKGSVDTIKITIFKNGNRDTIEILIKDIIKDYYYSDISTAPYRKNLPIKGDRPKYYIELQTSKRTYFLAQFKENFHIQWENAIKMAITKYKNFNIELNINMTINSLKLQLQETHLLIMNNCFNIKDILFNEEKRKMFFDCFRDKKLSSIMINILMYKDYIKKNQYLEAWMRFKEIFTYIESYDINDKNENKNKIITEKNNINDLFNQEKINKYKQISEAANENVKNIKIENPSIFLFQSEIKNALNDILKEDLFDDIFLNLYKIYVIPYFEEIKIKLQEGSKLKMKPLIRIKFQFLLALYFSQFSNMNMNNYNYLSNQKNKNNSQIRCESVFNLYDKKNTLANQII